MATIHMAINIINHAIVEQLHDLPTSCLTKGKPPAPATTNLALDAASPL